MDRDDRPVLAIDVDGVLADYNGAFVPYLSRGLGIELVAEDIIHHNYNQQTGASADRIREIMDQFEREHGIDNLEPIAGAIEAVGRLAEKYMTVVITGRLPHNLQPTLDWLKKHGILMPVHMANGFNNMVTTQHGRSGKWQVAQQLQVIALIEDNENEILNWPVDNIEIVAHVQPWNKIIGETHPHIQRLDWPGILQKFLV